jgi:transcriptional regulator with XRE-family HTH domain
MHIGKVIKNLRVLAGLGQQQLAEKIAKTMSLVSNIEKTGKVNYYTLVQIATALQTTPEKIELYAKTLQNPIKTADNNITNTPNLPPPELLKLENQLLKEQIIQLKKIIALLEEKGNQ